MTVITDIAVPADQFALGRLLNESPDITIELERLVPLRDGIISLFWVDGATLADLTATIETDPLSEEIRHLTEMDGRHLFESQWSPKVDALADPLIESGAEVLRATGTVDRWEFRLQFRNRARLATFRKCCQDNEVEMHLNALYNPAVPSRK